jgi:CspA family cold shock protein
LVRRSAGASGIVVSLLPPSVGIPLWEAIELQGVVKSYDPDTRVGVVVRDTPDRTNYDLAADALAGSIFRLLRPGQRVVFDLDANGCASRIRLGSEVDMGAPAPPPGVNVAADNPEEVEA